jgi:hypothetical protein
MIHTALAILFWGLTTTQPNVIDVRDFGAVPDDGKDDWFAIQSAIEKARDGQVIVFPAGTFDISRSLDPKSGRTFQGATQLRWDGDHVVADSQTILKSTGKDAVIHFSGEGLTIRNISFDGRGIFCDHQNGIMVRNLLVDNCWFGIEVDGENNNSIEFTTGMANSKITNCVFNPIKADNAIYGYNWDNLTIANNHFLNGNEGIHLTDFGNISKNLLIEQNYFAHLHRMGTEIQGGGVDTIFQDNYYEKPVLSARFKDNMDTFAYSIVADRSVNSLVQRNTSIAPERPDGTGVRIIFELGGRDLRCIDNYSVAGNAVAAVTGANATGIVQHNRFSDYLEGPQNNNGARAAMLDNDANTDLTWDINRGKPGPNKRLPTTKSAK